MTKATFTLRAYKANESRNYHTKNAVRLVETFGTESEKIEIAEIAKAHEEQGSITYEQSQRRFEISNKYYSLLK